MNEHQEKFEKALEHLKHELSMLRIGRASVALLDNIRVETYGDKLPIAHIATINVSDARTLTIQPWDRANMANIEKAISSSNLNLTPQNDGTLIRLTIPQMTEERRKEMVKVVGQLAEQARISIRNVREEIVKELKRKEDDNELTADDVSAQKNDLQEIVDKYNKQVKEIAEQKEKEIMTI